MKPEEIVWVGVCVLGLLTLRWAQRRGRRSAVLRWWSLLGAFMALSVGLAVLLGENLVYHRELSTRHGVSFGLVALTLGAIAWELRKLRPQVKAERTAVLPRGRPPRASRSSFFGQGLLILLPVVILAVIGLLALRRDYAMTEQEARQRAGAIARDLSARLGPLVAAELFEFVLVGNAWEGQGIIGGQVPWPGQPRLSPEEAQRYELRLADWRGRHPDLTPADALPVQASLLDDGSLSSPPDYPNPPSPALWWRELTPEQRDLWDLARSAELARAPEAQVRSAFDSFLASEPPAEAQANARFALLLLDLKTPPPSGPPQTPSPAVPTAGGADGIQSNREPTFAQRMESLNQSALARWQRSRQGEPNAAADRLLDFARRNNSDVSESGLPLATIALARAFREAEETGMNASLFLELSRQTYSVPCVALPRLLAMAESLSADGVPWVMPAVGALRDRWTSQERRRALARQVQRILRPSAVLTTNLWLDWSERRWLAILEPSGVFTPLPEGGQALVRSESRVSFFPKSAVQRAVADALDRAAVSIPPYLRLDVALEGEGLLGGGEAVVSSPGRGSAGVSLPLFASEAGQLSSPGRGVHPQSGQPSAQDFEALPSHPRFRLELRLADPRRLYSQARQRALLFGGVIVAAAATSLLGLVMARRAFDRQLRLSEMKTNFVSSVSHELRAPIASVRLLAESLDRGKIADPTRQAEYFRLIVQECRRLSSLIENVLDFSRIDQGRKQYEFEPTDLVALVRQTVQLMEPYAAERQVRLETHLDGTALVTHHASLRLDGRALQQALVNLLDNAIKHAPANTAVTVGLEGVRIAEREAGNPESEIHGSISEIGPVKPAAGAAPEAGDSGSVRLWVEDQGDGIPAGEHGRIFEPFYRRGTELRRETPGIGIGLTLVKHIAEAHGGRVSVRSAVGQGSRFAIELPACPN